MSLEYLKVRSQYIVQAKKIISGQNTMIIGKNGY